MKRAARICCVLSAVAILQAIDARAAPEELVSITTARAFECSYLRSSGEGLAVWSGNETYRARQRRVCKEANSLRQALQWEKQRATSTQSIWDAVFLPPWAVATAANSRKGSIFRREPSELTQRYEQEARRVLRGHPRSERQAFSTLAVEAVTTYLDRRSTLLADRVCAFRPSFKTGEELSAALQEVDTIAGSLKERLINDVFGAIDPLMATKLTAYAAQAQPTVWQASPAFFSDWTPEDVQKAIGSFCMASARSR